MGLKSIDVDGDHWSNADILPQCPTVRHRRTGRQNNFTYQVLCGAHLEPKDQLRRRPGLFSLEHSHESCVFFPFGGKMMALLARSIPAGLFMEPKEGDIQGGQPSVSKPESGLAKSESWKGWGWGGSVQ